MRWMLFTLGFVAVTVSAPHPLARGAEGPAHFDPAAVEFFEKKIRPLLADNCYNCHSANTNAKGGLRVDDRSGMLAGGGRGAAIVPGHPDKSLLLHAVQQTDSELKMPPKKHLSDEQIGDLTTWIKNGAAWPVVEVPATLGKPNPKYEKLRKEHWAWQPIHEAHAPPVQEEAWVHDDIDRFVIATLEKAGLKPVADADKIDLIRRVTFDLTGLPPTPGEIDAFVSDSSSSAFSNVVDRLLASRSFGERWGRHWLDVARYAESTGPSRNIPYPYAWRYRDYVIDAFNNDKPYDQFIREQIAGDLLPFANQQEQDEHRIATGFLALGVHDVNQRFKVRFVMDNIDEQIDTVSRSFLAMTASCARCHDHKFDPIPQTDYYGLAGIFHSSDLCAGIRNKMGGGGLDYYDTEMLIEIGVHKTAKPRADIERLKQELEEAKKQWFAIRGTPEGLTKDANGVNKQRPYRLKYEQLLAEYNASSDPASTGPVALGVREAKTISDTEIRIRGEAEKLGPVTPRGFLSVVHFPGEPSIAPSHSGRLELAEWLSSANNPLTSRVIVNRIWEHLFGQGLVKSVDNFGVTGDVPSHPELLDHLASRFVREGWSVKKLVREIVLTHAYQLGAEESAANMGVDPSDRLLWRHNPRRLDAEEIRDASLAAAGKLDLARPQASPANELKVRELANNAPQASELAAFARASLHRSVYLPLLRGLTPTSLEVFDFADQGMVTGNRDATTVSTQALYLLNDPFVRRQSLSLADRVLGEKLNDAGRVNLAYRLALGRAATAEEIERVTQFVRDFEAADEKVIAETPKAPAPPPAQVAIAPNSGATESGGLGTATQAASKQSPAAQPTVEKGKKNKRKAQLEAQAAAASTQPGVKDPKGAAAIAPPLDPDEIIYPDQLVANDVIQPADAHHAAWAAFCQALLGSAEFRYLK